MKTRSQQWSRFAFERVRPGVELGNARRNDDKYKTSCNKMPGLIHQSGLLQALVFQCARDADGELYVDHLAQAWFLDPSKRADDLIGAAQDATLDRYIALTRDVADIAQWFRRFAKIELRDHEEHPDAR